MLARDDRLVVRLVYVVRDIEKISAQPRKTIGLAHRIGEVFPSEREGQLQIRFHAPLVLPVEGQSVEGNWLAGLRRETLEIRPSDPIKEVRQSCALAGANGPNARIEIGNVIAPKAQPYLYGMTSLRDREIVDELVLSDVSPLRHDVKSSSERGEGPACEGQQNRLSLQSSFEIGHVEGCRIPLAG